MVNKKYQKGARFERKLVNEARKQGCISYRSAGSHSPIDVTVIDTKNKTIRFIQAKAKKLSLGGLKSIRDTFENWSDEYQAKFEILGTDRKKKKQKGTEELVGSSPG